MGEPTIRESVRAGDRDRYRDIVREVTEGLGEDQAMLQHHIPDEPILSARLVRQGLEWTVREGGEAGHEVWQGWVRGVRQSSVTLGLMFASQSAHL